MLNNESAPIGTLGTCTGSHISDHRIRAPRPLLARVCVGMQCRPAMGRVRPLRLLDCDRGSLRQDAWTQMRRRPHMHVCGVCNLAVPYGPAALRMGRFTVHGILAVVLVRKQCLHAWHYCRLRILVICVDARVRQVKSALVANCC